MTLLPLLQFIVGFYLFAASGALTYLSLRSWLHAATHPDDRRRWHEGHIVHLGRSLGFGITTVAALISDVSDTGQGLHGIDVVSLARTGGYLLLFATTPGRLRRRASLGWAFILLLIGQLVQIMVGSGAYPALNGTVEPWLIVATVILTDNGVTLLGRSYMRTVVRVRMTDKLMLSFAVFSLLLVMTETLVTAFVVRTSLQIPDPLVDSAIKSLVQTLLVLLVGIVVASAILSFFVARALSAPVKRMALTLRAIGRGDFDLRLQGIRSRDEIHDLASEINVMARRLKEADALRAEFVSFASHELRNPLTAVKGFIETLSEYDTDASDGLTRDERHEMYETIRSECDRLLRMTNELLDTSRVEAGLPVSLHVETFDIRREVAKVVEIMRTHTQRHELTMVAPERAMLIDGDVDKFDQILINLLSNAIKYAPRGGPIEVIAEDKGTTIDVSVRDQGIGMPAEQAERVFDKYYRIQDTAGRKRQPDPAGSGIGLYLTRALVNAHGGSIRVNSVPEQGSTFTVTLPKRQSSQERPKEIEPLPVVAGDPAGEAVGSGS